MKANIKKLNNGITVINVERESQAAYIKFSYKVGSKDEDDANWGVAHALEHMMFKGTTSRTAEDIVTFAESYAMDINAYTDFNETAYTIDCLAEDKEKAFELLSDMVLNSSFDPKEWVKEKKTICQERRDMTQTESSVDYYNLLKTMFANKYFNKNIIAEIEEIKKISKTTLVDFYNRFYNASNLTVVTCGKISLDETNKLIEKYLKNLPIGVANVQTSPSYKGEFRFGTKKKASNRINIAFAGNNLNPYALTILATILGGGMSSRLFQEIREKKGLVYRIGADFINNDNQRFVIMAKTAEKDVYEVVCEICKILQLESISDNELAKAKKIAIVEIAKDFESNEQIAEIVTNHFYIYNKLIDINNEKKQFEAITSDDVIDVAKKLFSTMPTYYISGKVKNKPSFEQLCKMLKHY